jgi:lipopolysaccharide transport system permease protein
MNFASPFGSATQRAHRLLLAHIFLRELKGRYLGTLTGAFWALIHPAILLAIYSFVFTIVFNVRFPEEQGSFLALVAIALWPWLATQESILRATTCIQAHGGLVRKVAFPHEVLVYGTVLAAFAVHLAGYLLVLVLLLAVGNNINLLALPSALVLLAILATGACGIALFTAALQVFLRDTEHFLSPLFAILFYLTPILYPLSLVPKSLVPIVQVNPITYICERLRDILLHQGTMWEATDFLAAGVALALFAAGLWTFRRLSPHFEDFL